MKKFGTGIVSVITILFTVAASYALSPLPVPEQMKDVKGNIIESESQTNADLRSVLQNEVKDWFNQDPKLDGIEGSSVDRSYSTFPIEDNFPPVVVAVIDSGVDINHEDLQGKIWINSDEVPGNGIDDDGNGYIDDIYGWNFIGGRDGSHVSFDTLEVTREYVRYLKKLESGDPLTEQEKIYFEAVEKDYKASLETASQRRDTYLEIKNNVLSFKEVLTAKLSLADFSKESLESIINTDPEIVEAKNYLLEVLKTFGSYEKVDRYYDYYNNQVIYYYNMEFDPRESIVKDDPTDPYESNYGNNDVIGPDASHGTHVAGIIAADRKNEIGIKGVASNAKIMVLRVVPNGDERDKDVANAVRYAVDNGAKILNMSFGKRYSPFKEVVDEAFLYAASKGVLIVHAAGNDSTDIDIVPFYPNRLIKDAKGKNSKKNSKIGNWVNVGASSYVKNETMVASFSNFGKKDVEIFAPGYRILSTVPGNQYASYSGTSMAAPVAAGVAALVLSQYPSLDGDDLREILMDKARAYPKLKVKKPSDPDTLVPFKQLSRTGGVADAYRSLSEVFDF